MVESLAFAPTVDWEPIPDAVFDELGPLPGCEGVPAGEGRELSSRVLLDLLGQDSLDLDALPERPSGDLLAVLNAAPATDLDLRSLTDGLRATGHLSSTVEAQRLRLVAAIAEHCVDTLPNGDTIDLTAMQVSTALHITGGAADRLIHLARHLTTTLTATLDAMEAGRLTQRQAQLLHETTVGLADDVARAIEARVLVRAHRQDPYQFARALRRARAALDPDWTERSRAARKESRVTHDVWHDGTAELSVRAPVEVTAVIHAALQAYADATKTELGGTVDERMIHALHTWAEGYVTAPGAPTRHGRAVTVNVAIDLASLLGLANRPGEIPGVGPVPADAVRLLVAQGAPMRRLVTDPLTGHLLDYGRRSYVAPPPLVDYLTRLYVRSAGPHSSRPATASDLDHNRPWAAGGTTDAGNLTPLDRRWHRAKTFSDWGLVKQVDGSVTWTSPTGHRITVEPHDYRLGP